MFLLPTVHRKERSLPCTWSGLNKGASDFRTVQSHAQQVRAAGSLGTEERPQHPKY